MKRPIIPKPVLAGFLMAEAALYAAFLTLDLLGRGSATYGLKYGGILLCLALALLCALRGGEALVAPALVFTAAADWFLLLWGDHLLLGVGLFLVVQALYALRLYRANARWGWRLRLVLALVFLLALFPLRLVTPLNVLALLYFSQLVSNAVLAWRIPSLRRFAVGMTAFMGCDICVGLFNAIPLPAGAFFLVSVGMWFFYLPSQVLIALSAMEVSHETK